jgi:signal transduction histidine kinase
VTLGLLLVVTRLFLVEAERQEKRRSAAEQETRELEKLVEARTRELSALSTHLQEFSEKEKSELARNLHDELGGLLTAAKMDLSWLQSRLETPAIQDRLMQLGGVLDEAMDLKRRVVEDLRPSLLDHFGLPTALRAHVDSVCIKAGLQADIAVPDDSGPIPKNVAIALFRIVQEGLTNIVRHAEARRVRLQVTTDGTVYAFTLSDDGRGFDSKDPQFRWSHGITGMRQRVRALGGRFVLESNPGPGGGTSLHVEVPKGPGAQPAQ